MLKRVLEEITNVRNKNIKLTIRREETPIRREITPPYLEYAEMYYNHANRIVATYSEIEEKYTGEKELKLYEEARQKTEAKKPQEKHFIRHIIRSTAEKPHCLGRNGKDHTEPQPSPPHSINGFYGYEEEDTSLLSIPAEELFRKQLTPQTTKRKITDKKTKKTKKIKKIKKQTISHDRTYCSPDTPRDTSSDELEIESIPDTPEYDTKNNDISSRVTVGMRTTLLEWMYDVKIDYKLSSTVYQTAVRIADKYFIAKPPRKDKYQLIGAVSLLVSKKLLEHSPTLLSPYIDVCDGAFTRKEFLDCEREILLEIGEYLNFLLPMHIIKEDRFLLGNSLTEYASEAMVLDVSYGSLTPKELSHFIETNIVALLTSQPPSEIFISLLRQSKVLLGHQTKQIKQIVS